MKLIYPIFQSQEVIQRGVVLGDTDVYIVDGLLDISETLFDKSYISFGLGSHGVKGVSPTWSGE